MSAPVKSIESAYADSLGREFAKEHNLPPDDPIVLQLVRGIRLSLGHRRWRNKIEAEAAARQPSLFPKPEVSA